MFFIFREKIVKPRRQPEGRSKKAVKEEQLLTALRNYTAGNQSSGLSLKGPSSRWNASKVLRGVNNFKLYSTFIHFVSFGLDTLSS